MFKNWFKPKNKFSLENLKYLHHQLIKHPVVTEKNKDQVVENLRTMAEVMIWGDQHNESYFEFFAEKNILSFFLKILTQKCDKRVKIQVIQTLSILIQNISSEMAIFYLLSNNYINDLIVHRFDFSDEELLAYYISFLKTLSLKLNERTIQFFFNEKANDFPLYTEALNFFNHPEQMVRIAVRTLTLNVYRVDYPALRQYILDMSAVPYFTNLVWFLRDETIGLDEKVRKTQYSHRHGLEEIIENLVDLMYYLQDILNLGIEPLSQALIDQLISHFTLPVLIGSIHDNASDDGQLISKRLALFLLAQLFMVFSHYSFINSVVTALIEPNPPVLAEALITSPPQYPVKTPVPITHILFPKSAPSGAPPSPSVFADADNLGKHNSPDRQKDNLPPDLNLKARGNVPSIGPVSSPVKACPNYRDLSEENVYRGALLSCLFDPDPDERHVFGAVSVLLTMLKNKRTDTDLLSRADLCPQHYSHSIRLLSELTSPLTDVIEDIDPFRENTAGRRRSTTATRQQQRSRSRESRSRSKSTGSRSHRSNNSSHKETDIPETKEAGSDGEAPVSTQAIAEDEDSSEPPSPVSMARYSNVWNDEDAASSSEEDAKAHAKDTSLSSPSAADPLLSLPVQKQPIKHVSTKSTDLSVPVPKGEVISLRHRTTSFGKMPFKLEYSKSVASAILRCLQRIPAFRLATVQLLVDLFLELVYDTTPGPCINEEHQKMLEEACARAGRAFHQRFIEPMYNLILDMVEDEWSALSRTPPARNLITNSMSLLPICNDTTSNIPMAYRHAVGDIEITRKNIQIYLVLRKLRFKIFKEDDLVFPVCREEADTKVGQHMDIAEADTMNCQVVVGKHKEQLLLIIDETLLLLGEAEKDHKASLAVVVPLRHQEAFIDRSNSCVLHMTIRSQVRPHPSCVLVKGTRIRPRWNLVLYFPDRVKCADAHRHLDHRRKVIRKELVEKIKANLPAVETLPAEPPCVPERTYSQAPPKSETKTPAPDEAAVADAGKTNSHGNNEANSSTAPVEPEEKPEEADKIDAKLNAPDAPEPEAEAAESKQSEAAPATETEKVQGATESEEPEEPVDENETGSSKDSGDDETQTKDE